jgi:NAD(P)-dependent dehydrogenase (short-subunit alcohol dehydrogenase family)
LTRPPGGVVLVTGGATRIGAVIAERLAADGWRVLIHYKSSHEEAAALVATLRLKGGDCEIVHADLSLRGDVEALIPTCLAIHGRLDGLINNAAVFGFDTIESVTWDSFDAHVIPNLKAPLLLCRDFALRLPDDRQGCIVNILDQKVWNLNPDFISYTLGKVGLAALTDLLAVAFAGRIRVCGIAPGITLRSGEQTDDAFERAWRATPLGRSATPEEIADTARFILSSPAMTGQVIHLDGGERLTRRGRDVAFDPNV